MTNSDRSWMYRRLGDGGFGIRDEFEVGLLSFLEFAKANPRFMDGDKIRCPCKKECKNKKFVSPSIAYHHIRENGFIRNYTKWVSQGEVGVQYRPQTHISDTTETSRLDHDWMDVDHHLNHSMVNMVRDAAGPEFDWSFEGNREEQPNPEAQKFYDTLNAANEELYDGCEVSMLSVVAQLLNIKAETNMPENAYNRMMSTFKSAVPKGNTLPENFYCTKKLVGSLGLGLQKIDACMNDCMIFYKEEDRSKTKCDVCDMDRYKPKRRGSSKHKKNIPYKVLRYLPLTPRLQRLYSEGTTAKDMRWHMESPRDDGVLTHPSDGEAWKHFDRTYQEFADDPRNVRLCLSSDGFNPFGPSAKAYSCWPVLVTPYNLPPWMCMKEPYMFLTLFIPGPSSPSKSIDVYLQPLIDELSNLWVNGVQTFDAYKKENFKLRAALMWTINDFPAYGMLSGWSTHGKMSCPYCMDRTKAFRLSSGGKPCFFDCHRQFLPDHHPFRRQRKNFTKGRVDKDSPLPRWTGNEVHDWVDTLADTNWGKLHLKERPDGFGQEHNWTKKSIFWQLPYWKTNLIRHNLDVMHIEKNVFDNVFNTVMDVKGKTKDTVKARIDLHDICDRKDLELKEVHGKWMKPKAAFTVNKEQKRKVLEWIQGLRLPDGYASNLGRCVNLEEGKMQGMKSHDCHIFLNRLLPVVFRDILPDRVWDALTELSQFFRTITSSILNVDALTELETSIAVTLCKLEMIFPPSFFDSMEHLPIHLAYEAKVGGPVQYRWMYPFERKVGNKARVEGSICEAYLVLEVAGFTSKYFDADVETKLTRVRRNDDGGARETVDTENCISVFRPSGRYIHKKCSNKRSLTDKEWDAARIYVLLNCIEVEKYLKIYEESVTEALIKDGKPLLTDNQMMTRTELEFGKWFLDLVKSCPWDRELQRLKILAWGPNRTVDVYQGYFVNGYVFHTESYGSSRSTMNSGVCLKGQGEYYGMLKEVIELKYLAKDKVVLFNCHWYDSQKGIKLHHKYDIVDVNHESKHTGNDVFILAMQAEQVYITPYPFRKKGLHNWWVVLKTKARSTINIPYKEISINNLSTSPNEIFQEAEMSYPAQVDVDIDEFDDIHSLIGEQSQAEEVSLADLPNMTTCTTGDVSPNASEDESGNESEFNSSESDEEQVELGLSGGEQSSGEGSAHEYTEDEE